MTVFEPVAIVGEGAVLPGALSPAALWSVVAQRARVYGPVPAETLGLTGEGTRVAGRVTDFDTVFDPARAKFSAVECAALDPVAAWPLHAALQAWDAAGQPAARAGRAGVILANLAYPSRAYVAFADRHWRGDAPGDPRSVLNASYPAELIARTLGLSGPVFSLDAACASSLYALEIACRRLHTRAIDVALVAAVNAADPLILDIGFKALNALSPTGRSRPFVKGADGLVPSEGAVAVVLKRLCDTDAKDRVWGVIRGIGLSNDGRRKGLLAPSREGQIEAMRKAHASADIDPAQIDYLECHATGTPTGDSTEASATGDVFAAHAGLPVGSLKANMGHLITVAGLASLLKLTHAFKHECLPATPIDGTLIDEVSTGRLSVVRTERPWVRGAQARMAAISNFGFGGTHPARTTRASSASARRHCDLRYRHHGRTRPRRRAHSPPTDEPSPAILRPG
jgi:acyl transferase domain-containing protein